METRKFLQLETLEEDVVYTVKTKQYLYGTEGYFYLTTVVAPDETEYYLSVFEEPLLSKLRANKTFTFTKTKIELEPGWKPSLIVVPGDNDVVELEV